MQEMERRRGMLGSLLSRRGNIERELESVSSEIADLESIGGNGQPTRHRGRGRPKRSTKTRGAVRRGRGGNEQSLAGRLHGLLRGRTMSVPEMAAAVKKAGHKSKSKNFNTVVGLALLSHKKLFRRVSRGQYTAR
jgi:hypothetical protein